MSNGSGLSSPASGPGAGDTCDSTVQSGPLGDLIVHVREDSAGGPVIQGAAVSISG